MKFSSIEARAKWDRRYAGYAVNDLTEPTPFVTSCLPELPPSGLALDIAAGAGRHCLALAQRGLRVDALDISWHGLRLAQQRATRAGFRPGSIQFVVADLELSWLPVRVYDVIVVSFFLYRPLFSLMKDRLAPGGWLIYETRVASSPQDDDRSDARNDFWLSPCELLAAFSDFDIVRYDEGHRVRPGGHRGGVTAQLLARNKTSK